MQTTKKTNTTELLKHCFDIMMLLKAKAIDVEEAKAQAHLIKQANNVFKYELDRAIAEKKYEGIDIKNLEQ